jgi:MFS transporter, MHS family, shikimate and dehydroshikimate transport protein
MTVRWSPHHRPIAARSGAISGGLTPFAAAAFMAWTDGATWPISIYLIVLAVTTFIATTATAETAGKELN